jgi:hypothetical protein
MATPSAEYSLSFSRNHNIAWYGIDRKFVAVHFPCHGEGCGSCQGRGIQPLTRKEAIGEWGSYTIQTLDAQQDDLCACQHLRRRHDQKGCVQCGCPVFVGDC